jgi:hypothetical protein
MQEFLAGEDYVSAIRTFLVEALEELSEIKQEFPEPHGLESKGATSTNGLRRESGSPTDATSLARRPKQSACSGREARKKTTLGVLKE